MSVQLLDKTRKINKLLHNNNSHKVVFNDICKVLSEILWNCFEMTGNIDAYIGYKEWEEEQEKETEEN